jgi:hypothetical protein
LVCAGKTNKQIALERHVKSSTVRSQLWTAYGRLGVVDRTQAALLFQKRGWVKVEVTYVERTAYNPPLTPSQQLYVDAFERWCREAPAHEVLRVLVPMVRGKK